MKRLYLHDSKIILSCLKFRSKLFNIFYIPKSDSVFTLFDIQHFYVPIFCPSLKNVKKIIKKSLKNQSNLIFYKILICRIY